MVFSSYKKLWIVFFYRKGLKAPAIGKRLLEEGMVASRPGIHDFLKRYAATGSISQKQGSGRKCKITEAIKAIVEKQMREDNETSALQLHRLLLSKGHYLSIRTVLRCRQQLGWTFRGSAYCQMIREANKGKRLEWARANIGEALNGNGFDDVIWSDESSIQLETHRRFCCHKQGEPPRNKPK